MGRGWAAAGAAEAMAVAALGSEARAMGASGSAAAAVAAAREPEAPDWEALATEASG